MSPRGSQVAGLQDDCIAEGRLRGILDREIGRIRFAGDKNISARICSDGLNGRLTGTAE